MLGPEPAWPLGQGHAQKKGKDLGFLLGSGHRKSPGSCSGGTSRFPQLLLLGECSPFLWECFLLLWECFLLLLGTSQRFLPQPKPWHDPDSAPSSAQHQSRHGSSTAEMLQKQCQSPREHCPSLLLSFSALPKALWCCLSSSARFPTGDSCIQPGHAASP